MHEPTPDDVLQVRGGYFSLRDAKFIYVNERLDELTRAEVRAHEAFHRTLTTTTIYGSILFIVEDLLRRSDSAMKEDPATKESVSQFASDLMKGMYIVQEGGAIARTFSLLGILHRVRSQEELAEVETRFFERLVPKYRAIGSFYIGFLRALYRRHLQIIAPQLFYYTNEALTAFTMNAMYFHKASEIHLTVTENPIFTDEVLPDKRLGKIMRALADDQANDLYFRTIAQGLKVVFGVKDLAAPAVGQVLQSLHEKDEEFEHKFKVVIDTALGLCFPEYAVPQADYVSYLVAHAWMKDLGSHFEKVVPGYERPKVQLATSNEDKKWVIDNLEKKFR